jgi:cyanophycin synthetase
MSLFDETNIAPSQPRRRVSLSVRFPQRIDPLALDRWLEAFAIPLPPHPHPYPIVHRALLIYVMLLQASQIPIFDVGECLGIAPDPSDPTLHRVDMELSHVGTISESHFRSALAFAFSALNYMVINPLNDLHREKLFQAAFQECINPILSQMPRGKSRIYLLKAAYENNIPFTHLGNGIYHLGWGSRGRLMDRSSTDADSVIGSRLAQNKLLTAEVIRTAGLPAPLHTVARNGDEALSIARRIGFPVVVKPLDQERGEGVSVGIYEPERLAEAFEIASNASKAQGVIVEKQVEGICYRLFVAQGRLLFAMSRLPVAVCGDGCSSVLELIERFNADEMRVVPWKRKKPLMRDELSRRELAAQGFDFDSVPPSGVWVRLRDIESTRWGGRAEEVSESLHPANADIAVRAAALFALDVAGIDLITSDIAKPWYESGAIINEVNYSPMFASHPIYGRYMAQFYRNFLGGDGRIAIHLFVGENSVAWECARKRGEELRDQGVRCYLCDHTRTYDETGNLLPLSSPTLGTRIKALLLNNRVDALSVALSSDELLHAPLPFDRVSSVNLVSNPLRSHLEEQHFADLFSGIKRRLMG